MLNRHEKFAIFNLSLVVTGILLFILIWQIGGIKSAPAGFAVFGFGSKEQRKVDDISPDSD